MLRLELLVRLIMIIIICIGLAKNVVLVGVLAQNVAQILHRDRLYLVFAEREAFSENLIFNLV